jgi:hypothetical protein
MWGQAYAMSSLPFGLVGPTVIGSVSLGGGARSSPSRRCTDVNRGEVPVQRVEAVNHDTPAPVRRRRRSRGERGGREGEELALSPGAASVIASSCISFLHRVSWSDADATNGLGLGRRDGAGVGVAAFSSPCRRPRAAVRVALLLARLPDPS